jgi:hypothetical protein
LLVGASADTTISSCTSTSQRPQALSVTVNGQPATGIYSLPAGAPRGIVVVGHGFPGTAAGGSSLVQQIATNDQVVALAMNYWGTDLVERRWLARDRGRSGLDRGEQAV